MTQAQSAPGFRFPSPPDRLVRLGVIGLGWVWTECHLPSLVSLQAMGWPIKVVAICDVNPTRLETGKKLIPEAIPYLQSDELLERDDLDGVLILTYPNSSLVLLEKTLARGITTFVEKPVADSVDAINRCDANAREQKIPVQVGYNRRYQLLYDWFISEAAILTDPISFKVRFWRANRSQPIFFADTLVHPLEFTLGTFGPMDVRSVNVLPTVQTGALDHAWRIDLVSQKNEFVTAEIDIRPAAGRNIEVYEVIGRQQTLALGYAHSCPATASLIRSDTKAEKILHSSTISAGEMEKLREYSGFLRQMADFVLLSARLLETPRCGLAEAGNTLRLFTEIISTIDRHKMAFR